MTDSYVEPKPLWEYPCKALGNPVELMSIDFNNFEKNFTNSGKMSIEITGNCNGIALWIDWHLDDSNLQKNIVSTGSKIQITPGEYIDWDIYSLQGVHLFSKSFNVNTENFINWENKFEYMDGKLDFKFERK